MPVAAPTPYRLGSAQKHTAPVRYTDLVSGVLALSSCLVARCRHETETTLVPTYSFRKGVPTGVGSNLGFDTSPLGVWLIRRSTPLCLIAFPTRKYFRTYSPSAGVSGCLQTLQWINR